MVGNGQAMMACQESGGPCDSWWPVVGGTDGWQLVASGWRQGQGLSQWQQSSSRRGGGEVSA